MRPIRWTVLATQVPPGGSLGGIVRYTTEFIAALAARDDVVVSAVTTKAAADTLGELVGNGEVRTVPDVPTPLLSIAERWAPLPAPRGGTDVVHGVKHLLPRRSRALRVLTVHDMLLLDRPADFGPAKRALLPANYRASIRDADLLLCVSDATRRRMRSQLPASDARARVVHLATSSSMQRATPRAVTGLVDRRFALVVGDPTPRKNLRTLMTAWSLVREQVPDAVLAVAGPPSWGRTDVGAVYDGLVEQGAVVPLGHIDDAGLRWAYEHAQVVLCPSLVEGYGLPAAEALDFGAPLIISDDPAMVEVSAGRARAVLPATDVDRWRAAAVAAFEDPDSVTAGPSPTARTWAQVADESVEAVAELLHARG